MMSSQELLDTISDYCRRARLAESTFGRLAANDGKLVGRLRDGGRITLRTLERLQTYMTSHPTPAEPPGQSVLRRSGPGAGPGAGSGNGVGALMASVLPGVLRPLAPRGASAAPEERSFRFFDNRQKYLLFVHTCSEKQVVAERVAMELAHIHPRPPAVRMFDAGVGDGSVLSRVMRAMHARFPTMPFYVVGKEISLEDVRLALEKMPDRFYEHPATVLVMTNLNYAEAPSLAPASIAAATTLVWHECVLTGTTSHEFEEQINGLGSFLGENWRAHLSPRTGNPVYERPIVLVIYRADHRFLLDRVIPRPGSAQADYDLVIASQPYRARASLEFKARRVIGPLARGLGPGGRLLAIHSHGNDPGMEIVRGIWPEENPFQHDRHQLLKAVKAELGAAARGLNFGAYADARSLFRYEMHTLPTEIAPTIGTSTLFAAWNAAIYVGQIEDARLESVIADRRYLDVTRDVLQRHGSLWFWDESFVISRRRD